MPITLETLHSELNLKLLTPESDLSREVTAGYCCDLLSWALAHGGTGGVAWVTVQTHMNVVAVATLLDMACVILPDNIDPEPDALQKANDESIAIFKAEQNAYALCGQMWAMGIGQANRS
ncbi:MAG: AraC family transcriptional regulator [Oscillospiraceae bacterium]|jgi:hypothetical protein|nr:AraC family transcriptional regulator [Oscillospiraceae bacterium]